MAELNLKKIATELNRYFDRGIKYVFWYDDHQDFRESINELKQDLNVDIWVMNEHEQFKTKRYLTQHEEQQFLIYAPYAQPKVQEDFLADMERYSMLFSADASQILLEQLGFNQDKLSFVRRYSKYFAAKARIEGFQKYYRDQYRKQPELGIIMAITKSERFDINELVIKILQVGLDDETNKYLVEFNKFNVLDTFWALCEQDLGFSSAKHSLHQLVIGVFATYTFMQLDRPVPKKLSEYDFANQANTQIFLDRLADSNKHHELFARLSRDAWETLDLADLLTKVSLNELASLTMFAEVNELILARLRDNYGADGVITDEARTREIIEMRQDDTTYNFAGQYVAEYRTLEYALRVLVWQAKMYDNWNEMLTSYVESEFELDTDYRKFIDAFQEIKHKNLYFALKKLVDDSYNNRLLNDSVVEWNQHFNLAEVPATLRQQNFYKNVVSGIKERVVVIISDAFRFEAAKQLEKILNRDDRIKPRMGYLLTGLPSVTYMGMPTLLPHQELAWDNRKLRVDGKLATSADYRKKILQDSNQRNDVYQLNDLLNVSSRELKDMVAGKDVVYVYHNQIDARGDDLKTENETFKATHESIDEIESLVQSLRIAGVVRVIITADHGFIYREAEIKEQDKIDVDSTSYVGDIAPRYLITKDHMDIKGVSSATLGDSLQNGDQTNVYYPTTLNVFKAKGGKNYIHGGSSLQEMIVPVLDLKTSDNRSRAKYAELKLATVNPRINNLEVPLQLNQVEAISDKVMPCDYKLYFVDDQGTVISNMVTVRADSKGTVVERSQRVVVNIQNKQYDRYKDYYLIINRETKDPEQQKIRFQMNLISDDGLMF